MIVQGDQYAIPIKVSTRDCHSSHIITPSDIADIKIKIGDYEKSYSNEELTFDEDTQCWEFPLTETMSKAFSEGTIKYQVAIKIGDNDYVYSNIKETKVFGSIISSSWS